MSTKPLNYAEVLMFGSIGAFRTMGTSGCYCRHGGQGMGIVGIVQESTIARVGIFHSWSGCQVLAAESASFSCYW